MHPKWCRISFMQYHSVDDIPFESLRALKTRQRFSCCCCFPRKFSLTSCICESSNHSALVLQKDGPLCHFSWGTTVCSGRLPSTPPKTRISPLKDQSKRIPTKFFWCYVSFREDDYSCIQLFGVVPFLLSQRKLFVSLGFFVGMMMGGENWTNGNLPRSKVKTRSP